MIGTIVGCLVIILVIGLVLGIAALWVAAYFFGDALQWLQNPYIPNWVADILHWILQLN